MSAPVELPGTGESWVQWLADRTDAQLRTAQRLITQLKDGTARSSSEVLERWNDIDIALRSAESAANLFAEVHPDQAVRTLAEQRAQDISRVETDRSLDRALYDVVAATEAGDDKTANRLREYMLRDFRRSGVDRDDEVRARLREIAERLTVLDQDFGRAIRDDLRAIKIRPDQLDGMPDDFVAAHHPGDDGLVTITTDNPDLVPFRKFARNSEARAALMRESLNRAWPQNDAVLAEMLALRAEQAGLLGYSSWPDYDAEVKMIGTGAAIINFIDKLSDAADSAAHRDYQVLLARRQQDEPSATSVGRADFMYYEELVRRENFDVDAQEVRRYLDFTRARAGLLDTTARLFGITYRPRADIPVWDDDVAAYDVERDGACIGRIYLDLHPREGKFKHAAQFTLAPGVTGRQLPEGALVCNFARGLMEHRDLVTMFHEFGHLMHHILGGEQRWARFSGVATEWDFVEAPSQMLEEWAWNADVLAPFAIDADGVSIPGDLVARMRDAQEFGKGYFVRTQLYYAAVSYLLHRDCPEDITLAVRAAQVRYEMFADLEDTHFHAAFGHLAGYGSAYYTYLWSLVIAKDMFSAFDGADLFDPSVAHRYRDCVLARGGTQDAADLVAEFLGRNYSFDAFERWLDTVPVSRT